MKTDKTSFCDGSCCQEKQNINSRWNAFMVIFARSFLGKEKHMQQTNPILKSFQECRKQTLSNTCQIARAPASRAERAFQVKTQTPAEWTNRAKSADARRLWHQIHCTNRFKQHVGRKFGIGSKHISVMLKRKPPCWLPSTLKTPVGVHPSACNTLGRPTWTRNADMCASRPDPDQSWRISNAGVKRNGGT